LSIVIIGEKITRLQVNNFIESSQPDIAIGTGIWVISNIKDNKIFLENYQIYRKDRVHQDCGRVLFAIKHDINCMVVPKLSLDDKNEIIWAKI
jgi:hypothetical protein